MEYLWRNLQKNANGFGQSPASAGFADISLCCCAAWGWYITGVWRTRWARACPALPQRRHSSSAAAFPPCILLVFLAAHFLKQNLALKTAVLVFLAGLCFVFANPPMQAPDETMHFLRAYAVGSGQFLFDEKQQFPNDVNLLVRDFPGAYINGVSGEKLAPDEPDHRGRLCTVQRGQSCRGRLRRGAFTPVQQLVPYFPQALGVAVGRLFGADALACMYSARAANLLCYAVLCGYAAAVIRRFSAVLIALAISPVSLFMAGSCSSDGLLHGPDMDIYRAVPFGRCDEKEACGAGALLWLDVPRKIHHAGAAAAVAAATVSSRSPAREKRRFRPPRSAGGVLAVCLAAGVIIYALLTGYTALASNYGRVPYADTGVAPGPSSSRSFCPICRATWRSCLYSVYRDKANLCTMLGNFGWMDMNGAVCQLLCAACCCCFASRRVGAGGRAGKAAHRLGVSGDGRADVRRSPMRACTSPARPSACRRSTACRARYLLGALFRAVRAGSHADGPHAWRLQNAAPGPAAEDCRPRARGAAFRCFASRSFQRAAAVPESVLHRPVTLRCAAAP